MRSESSIPTGILNPKAMQIRPDTHMTACSPLVTVRNANENWGIIQRNVYKNSSRIPNFEERHSEIEGMCMKIFRPWRILRNFEQRDHQIEGTFVGGLCGT